MTIGFFDSGVGGFHVMERVIVHMPQYDYVFFGDTKHLPYGDKSEEEIYRLTRNAVWYLFSAHNARVVVLACNTASAETLRRLQDEFLKERYPERKILGVIIPTVEAALEASMKDILLIGTTRTIESQKYEKEFTKRGITARLSARATPELVPLIEVNRHDEACALLRPILKEHRERGGDGVILGCTHYGVLAPRLEVEHEGLRFFSQEEIIPHKLEQYLKNHPEIEEILTKKQGREVMWSGKDS